MPSDRSREIRQIRKVRDRDAAETIEGSRWGPKLLEVPASSWHRLLRENAHYRSFGTLRYLLEAARSKFEHEPTVAVQITSLVLAFVDDVSGPSRVYDIRLRALARKEHANALRVTGDLKEALRFARESVAVCDEAMALDFYAAQAKLVAAQVLYEMGEYDEATEVTRQCIRTFDEFQESTYRILARLTQGLIHFGRKQFRHALSAFRDVVAQAEREGNKDMLVRGLHNAAEAARELGDIEAARELYPRVLKYMDELGLTTEIPRVTWSYALTLLAEGKAEFAISELYKVRNLYQHFGMNLDAATAELEIVRIRFQLGQEVTEACSRLVESFVRSGASQNALEAYAYLREQSAAGKLSLSKIERVRTFSLELARKPNLLFVPPMEDE